MRRFMAWGEPTPYEVVFLDESDLTDKKRFPRKSFVDQIVKRVVRRGDIRRPGFVVIPNPMQVFDSREEVFEFQSNLMKALSRYIEQRWPRLLKPYFTGDRRAANYENCKLKQSDFAFGSGLDSFRSFHTDVLSQHYVSICYHRREGVIGGFPRFLDLLAFCRKSRIKHLDYVENIIPSNGPFNSYELYATLRTGMFRRVRPFITNVVDLNFRRDMPIIIFSNQWRDGIMHGVTPLTEAAYYPLRSISYCSIGHRETDFSRAL